MAADNNLSPYSFRDIWEMESVGSRTSVDVLVFHDHAESEGMWYRHIAKNPDSREYEEAFEEFIEKKKLQDLFHDRRRF
jgi:hypothetical protein